MTEQVTFGLIGCGAAGKIHARAMSESEHVDLRWVMDSDPRAARALGERHGVSWTTNLDQLLEDAAVDAVSIAAPHHLHLGLAERSARAGKHVLLEKPFTLNAVEAGQLVDVSRESRVVCAPWLERRFLPYVDRAREIVDQGELGNIVYTRVCTLGYKPRAYWEYGMRFEDYPSEWRARRATSGGGILIMNAIHQIDLMAFLTGLTVSEVFARTGTLHHEVEVEDIAVANVKYGSGALGIIEASCCTYGVGQFPIEGPADAVMGTDGHLQLGSTLKCFDRIRHCREWAFPKLTVTDQKMGQLADFARHLREGTPLRSGPNDAIRVHQVIEAAYRSAESNLPCTTE